MYLGRSIPGRAISKCEGPQLGVCSHLEIARRSCDCKEMSDESEVREEGKEVVLWLLCEARCETISGFGQNSDMVTYGHSGCYVTNRL